MATHSDILAWRIPLSPALCSLPAFACYLQMVPYLSFPLTRIFQARVLEWGAIAFSYYNVKSVIPQYKSLAGLLKN